MIDKSYYAFLATVLIWNHTVYYKNVSFSIWLDVRG